MENQKTSPDSQPTTSLNPIPSALVATLTEAEKRKIIADIRNKLGPYQNLIKLVQDDDCIKYPIFDLIIKYAEKLPFPDYSEEDT
ncbi:MAG: hypothetical protein LBD11_08850 [Candidatus Peribacteria bacterium]|jgi:hypothetical protein|nr:hypothetical protein [Candidatus Peribacteria bacterium]